jgi:hypothetical protein
MQPFLFLKLEKSPKGTHFQSSKDIYKKTAELQHTHKMTSGDGLRPGRLEWCVASDGNCFKWANFRTIISLIKHAFGANLYIIETLL